jgi:hypothetical protein
MTTIDLPPLDTEPHEETLLRAEPNDTVAEEALLGRLILAHDTRRALTETRIAATDYYRPAHQLIHTAITRLAEAGQPVDPLTLTAALQGAGHLTRVGGRTYLGELVQAANYGASLDWLAARIQDLALRRALARTGAQIRELGLTPQAPHDISFPGAEYAERAVQLIRDVRDAGRAAEDTPVMDLLDFLAGEDEDYDWVLPGYLERGDRIIWTAGEGGGKSVLLRQIAVCTAAGVLPFNNARNPLGPRKVLVLDCENNTRQSRRHYRKLQAIAARQAGGIPRGHFHFDLKPEGVDLTRGEGRSWLMRRVEEVQPDLLVVGPIYRLHAGDPNSEEQARKVTVALDQARLYANSAMVLEAHAAKPNGLGPRSLAPVGSSLWLRWPEFGLGLRPVEDEMSAENDRARRVIPWRGGRDERDWPTFIRQGYTGEWPWKAYRPIDADHNGHSRTGAIS